MQSLGGIRLGGSLSAARYSVRVLQIKTCRPVCPLPISSTPLPLSTWITHVQNDIIRDVIHLRDSNFRCETFSVSSRVSNPTFILRDPWTRLTCLISQSHFTSRRSPLVLPAPTTIVLQIPNLQPSFISTRLRIPTQSLSAEL